MNKKRLFVLLKVGIPLGIIFWLLSQVDRDQAAKLLRDRENWIPLAGGFALSFAATVITFIRWHLLVRALNLPFHLADAFRLGFLGHLLTFISGGSVGGDLFKAVFLAHEQPGRRAEAVATVLVDRVVGMVALLLITSLAILVAAPADSPPVIQGICDMTLGVTVLSLVLLAVVLVPRHPSEWLLAAITRIPKLGAMMRGFVASVGVYRSRPGVLLVTLAISCFTHMMFVFSLAMVARAVLDAVPSLGEHAIIVPLSMVAGALPLTPGGLGTFELAMDQLYAVLPEVAAEGGILVALAYRMMTILIAVVGMIYYWSRRREVDQLWDEAEQQQASEATAAGQASWETQASWATRSDVAGRDVAGL